MAEKRDYFRYDAARYAWVWDGETRADCACCGEGGRDLFAVRMSDEPADICASCYRAEGSTGKAPSPMLLAARARGEE